MPKNSNISAEFIYYFFSLIHNSSWLKMGKLEMLATECINCMQDFYGDAEQLDFEGTGELSSCIELH